MSSGNEVVPDPEVEGPAETTTVHGRVKGADPARGGAMQQTWRVRRVAAAGGTLRVAPDYMTPAGREGRSGWLVAQRGRKADPDRGLAEKNAQLEGANRRLTEKLRKAEIIIEFQKNGRAVGDAESPRRRGERRINAGSVGACQSFCCLPGLRRGALVVLPTSRPREVHSVVVSDPRPVHRRLTSEGRAIVLDTLNCERLVDPSPAEGYATLLDEGVYLCSMSDDVSDLAWLSAGSGAA